MSALVHWRWPNLLVILYTFCGWGLGVYLLTSVHPLLNVIGVLLTAHTLIYSGYLIHECVHHSALASLRANDRLGMNLQWASDVRKEIKSVYAAGKSIAFLPSEPADSTIYQAPGK